MTQSDMDNAVAQGLNIPPDVVKRSRLDWNNNAPLRGVFTARIEALIKERQQALEQIEPENLKAKQAEITALRLALTSITKTET